MLTAGPCFEHDVQSTFGLMERVGAATRHRSFWAPRVLSWISELSWSQVAVDRQLVIAFGVIRVRMLRRA